MRNRRFDQVYLPAAWQALAEFPLKAKQVTPISLSENLTFRVVAENTDTDFVLRLHRPHYNSLEELNSERVWTAALNEAGIAVPETLHTKGGEYFTLVDIPEVGEQRYAGVTTWTTGQVLRDYLKEERPTSERRGFFVSIGEMVARMHNHSVNWNPPGDFTRRRLDVEALLGEQPVWGRFWEHASLSGAERSLLLSKRSELKAALKSYGESPESFSLIHADVDPGNLIHRDGKLAIIDFDDAAFGWHIYDLATTLDEFMVDGDAGELQAALIRGYASQRQLNAEALDLLPSFRLIRGMALMGWYHQRPEHAGDPYFDEVRQWVVNQCQ